MVIKEYYDVIVCGGGTSGVVAAIAAARNGANVLVVEKYGFLGGTNTASLVGPLMTFHGGEEQIVKGIPDEIVGYLVDRNASPGYVKDPLGFCSTIVPFDVEALKDIYFELSINENIDLCLHTYIKGTLIKDNEIKGIECVNKSGKFTFKAQIFIDATGDGDIAYYSGVECCEGSKESGLVQPMSMLFTVGGVEVKEIKDYMKRYPEQFILDSEIEDIEKMNYIAVSGFFSIIEDARKKGDFNISRDRVLFFENPRKGEVTVNMTRISHDKHMQEINISQAEVEGRKQVNETLEFLKKYIPGFEKSYLLTCGSIGIRESRRIKGMYTLNSEDIIEGKKHSDSIARGAFPIDIHNPSSKELTVIKSKNNNSYDIPYGVLIPKTIKGLIVTGRCISATHKALASARVSATAMALGQAAGTAAALAVREDKYPHELNIEKLRQVLISQGASIGKK